MEIFKGLQPELVWSYFEEICKIPRPSKKRRKNSCLVDGIC